MQKLSLLCILIICFTGNDLLNAHGTNQFRSRQCLNGWWDFLPVLTPDGKKYTESGKIPADGWLKNSMINSTFFK